MSNKTSSSRLTTSTLIDKMMSNTTHANKITFFIINNLKIRYKGFETSSELDWCLSV